MSQNASTPSPPASPRDELLHLIGSPAGRALASRVEVACAMIRPLEISDTEYARASSWTPPIPISTILQQVLRPSVFVLQQAVDPSFHRTGYGSFQFPYTTTCIIQSTLRKMMELVHLISLTDPDYPSYVALWDGISAVHLIPDEPPVSDRTMGQLEILEYMVEVYGFNGENSTEGRQMLAALEHLKRVATCWAGLLGTRGEYPEFEHSGRMMRRPVFDPGLIVHALLANLSHKARTSVDNIPSSNLFFMATSVGERFAAPRWLSDVDDEFLAYEDQSPGQRLRESCSELIIPSMDRTDGFFEPRYSMKDLLRFFIRGQIFFVQSTVDPLFHLCSPFRHLAAGDMIDVREALRRIIDQLTAIHDSRPSFAHMLVAQGTRIHTDELLVPGESCNMFRILRVLLEEYGFRGDEGVNGEPARSAAKRILDRFETTAKFLRASTAQLAEFPEYNHDGSSTFMPAVNLDGFTDVGALLFPSFLPNQRVIVTAMALRFALLRNYRRNELPTRHSRTQFEVFFIDFDTDEELVRYLRRPEVSKFSLETLAPLRDQVMLIRDRFHGSAPLARDSSWIRRQTAVYMRSIGYVRQAICPDSHGSVAKRVPTPSVASLLYMIRIIRRFGFEGDEISAVAEYGEHDLMVVYNHAHDTIFAMSIRLADIPPRYATLSEIEKAVSVGQPPISPSLGVRHVVAKDEVGPVNEPTEAPVELVTHNIDEA
ncbi:hypothetical protein C8F04DRAFT_1190928 [Mycena alexandri]|uniref:Uncharacterized protein n=1 Tax=Mycena alexandri TaxID=1745969 RepID=A0AAD6SDL7_9AGAR|nr:hypothetical protein C8F04DRAFT_1190928 [Mycena alexandri]